MDVQMIAQEFFIAPSLRDYLERRLHLMFARARKHVARVVVRLRDLNKPHGGPDKLCQVRVTLPGRPEVVIQEIQEDMSYAIDSALKRAAYRALRIATCKGAQ
jgi:ribosome-associated translation inhibitor RaiA